MGCATLLTWNAIEEPGKTTKELAVSDEILALGRPDETLAQKLGRNDVVAFLGTQYTYMIFEGGAELERIARSGLDPQRIQLDAAQSGNLSVSEHQVWGDVRLVYTAYPQEQATLSALGFAPTRPGQAQMYERKVYVQGLLYPALEVPPRQGRLHVTRPIRIYRTQETAPGINYTMIPLLPLAVATDVLLSPVYLGVGLVALVSAATE